MNGLKPDEATELTENQKINTKTESVRIFLFPEQLNAYKCCRKVSQFGSNVEKENRNAKGKINQNSFLTAIAIDSEENENILLK